MWRDRGNHVHLSADEARGGEVILRTRRRRTIFLAGLIGFVLLAFMLGLVSMIR
jgi:hypothetical protein